jgi:hypothetical protein
VLSKSRTEHDWIGTLWKAHFIDRQMRRALAGLFSPEPDPSLIRLLARKLPTLSPAEIRAGLSRIVIRLDIPDSPDSSLERPTRRRSNTEKAHVDNVPKRSTEKQRASSNSSSRPDVSVQELISAGIIRPPLSLEKSYKGHRLTARLEADGRITCLGRIINSLSASAGVARASIIGAPPGREFPATNGWVFWKFRDEDGGVKNLDVLRQRYQGKQT